MTAILIFAPVALLSLATVHALRRARSADPLMADIAPGRWERHGR